MKPLPMNLWVVLVLCITTANGCRYLINQLAFFPDRSSAIPQDDLPAGTREVAIATPDGERLQAYFIPYSGADRLLVYFHGNAGNIGHRLPDLHTLAKMGLNVLGVGYRGYGQSSGRPSEAGIYIDGRAALDYAVDVLGFSLNQILLLGRSIGSTVAVDVARSRLLAGVILVTPMTSGKAVAKAVGYGPLALLAGRAFDNLSKIRQMQSPVLIIHGTADEVIPFDQGRQLHAAANPPKQFISISGAGHNTISLDDNGAYWKAIWNFISDLPMPSP